MDLLIRGAISGLAGTAAMTAAMVGARAAGLLGRELPPREVGRNVDRSLGVLDDLPAPAFEASWMAQHLAYGAAAGVAYELARKSLNLRQPGPSGLAFGAALWAVGYAGWVPALGLAPPPNREPGRRLASQFLSHLLYGATTAAVSEVLHTTNQMEASPLLRHRA